MNRKLVFLSILFSQLLLTPHFLLAGQEEDLDSIGLRTGADKSSIFHYYTKVYDEYLSKMRHDNICFLEIGIYQGASVKMWEEYFPNAELHFIDINPGYVEYHSERSQYHFLDQSNKKALISLCNSLERPFEVIIDDGGHTMQQQRVSFETLFPFLKSGGLYIIEDLHTSYWKQYGGGGTFKNPKPSKHSTINFLKDRIDDLNMIGAKSQCADKEKAPKSLTDTLTIYQNEIEYMHFYDSVCIIKKR